MALGIVAFALALQSTGVRMPEPPAKADIAYIHELQNTKKFEAVQLLEPFVTGPDLNLRAPAVEAIQNLCEARVVRYKSEVNIAYTHHRPDIARIFREEFQADWPLIIRYCSNEPTLVVKFETDRRSSNTTVRKNLVLFLAAKWFGRDKDDRRLRFRRLCGNGRPNLEPFYGICAENLDACLQLLQDENCSYRGGIISGLRDYDDPKFEAILISLSRSRLSTLRADAIGALAKYKSDEAIKTVVESASDKCMVVRFAAARALAITAPEYAASLLRMLANDPLEDVRDAAEQSLRLLEGNPDD